MQVFGRLLDLYEPATALKWLRGTNALLGNRRPIDVLAEGKWEEVWDALERERDGSYA